MPGQEYNNKWIFYSTAYDKIVADPEDRPRYMNLCGVNPELMVRNIGKVDNNLLTKFIMAISDFCEAGKTFCNHISKWYAPGMR